MNLSKLLVSVNIAATLPIAVQIAAQASNQNGVTEANSFKDSVTALSNQSKSSMTHVSVAKKSFKLVKETPASVEVDGVKLRAFLPGRKLPSTKELQLVSQRAQMAPEQSLNGSVSETYTNASPYTYAGENGSNSAYKAAAPRVVLNQVQAVARQIRTASNKKKIQQNIAPTSIAPETASSSMQNTVADFGQFSKDVPASWMANEKNLSLIQAPNVSPKEMAQIDRQIERSHPPEATGTAGPAPFPLSLLPQQSLKQFVGAKPQNRPAAPPSFFGSWHNAMSNQPTKLASNLAPAGFRTNMHGSQFGSYAAPHAGSYATPHAGQRSATSSFKPSNNKHGAHQSAGMNHAAPVPKVAAYAPYSTTPTY
jgi:hypothetical protein